MLGRPMSLTNDISLTVVSNKTSRLTVTICVRLRKLALTCEFGQLTDELIRDRIVCGITDNATKKKLLQEPDLNLNKCLDLCRATETSKSQLKIMSSDHQVADTTVHAIYKTKMHKMQRTQAKNETDNYCR